MSPDKEITKIRQLLKKKGKKIYERAKEDITQEKIGYKPVEDALRYFTEKSYHSSALFPALLSLTCEAVGGDKEDVTTVGIALIFITGAVDIHDDIIDQSESKGSKPTLLGKFGRDIALLAGDALLIKGLTLLKGALEHLPKKKRREIMDLTKNSLFEIGSAEAKESSLKGNWELSPEGYLEIIRKKAAIFEAIARIGAILGGGSDAEINALGGYGRILGILSTMRDDYIDIFEPDEIRNRAKNEILPLPILYAFRNEKAKNNIAGILKKGGLNREDTTKILGIIFETEAMEALNSKIDLFYNEGNKFLRGIETSTFSLHLHEILQCMIEGLVRD